MTTGLIQTIDTPDGPFTMIADPEGRVLASGWTDDEGQALGRIPVSLRPDRLTAAALTAGDAARSYYAGDVAGIDQVEVRQVGTEMQLVGWRALRRIDPGAPLSYTAFAAELGSPRAVRAAASICARNAPALFVPCHRVLRGDGSLGGFAWGTDVKRALLDREARFAAA